MNSILCVNYIQSKTSSLYSSRLVLDSLKHHVSDLDFLLMYLGKNIWNNMGKKNLWQKLRLIRRVLNESVREGEARRNYSKQKPNTIQFQYSPNIIIVL